MPLEQIKRDPSNEVQKINLGWRGYIPGYKKKATKQINSQIRQEFEDLPGKKEPVSLGSRENRARNVEQQSQEIVATVEEQENELAQEQELYQIQQKAIQLYQEGMSYSHPSYFKYFVILMPWAILVDAVDVLDLTGIGAILGRAFSIFSWVSIMAILWFTDGKLKRAHHYTENLEHAIADLQKDISRTTRFALKSSKVLRKVPGMKNVARQIPKTLVKIRRVARKNPITKVLIGGAINAIPLLAVLNLMFVWVYLSYRDEKKSYKGIREQAEETHSQLSQEISQMV